MKVAIVVIEFTLETEDDSEDYPLYFEQAGEGILQGIPKEWWEVTEESLHITEARVTHVQVEAT